MKFEEIAKEVEKDAYEKQVQNLKNTIKQINCEIQRGEKSVDSGNKKIEKFTTLKAELQVAFDNGDQDRVQKITDSVYGY